MWASCVCNAWADEPRFNQNQTGTTNTQSTTAQALYKNSLYKKMRGWIFLPHICFVEYIYICKWKIRNWGTLEFLRLNKLDVCEGAPLRPCSIFLTMKWFIKTRFYSEREMEPASLGTKHPPKWTLHNHGMVGNDKQKAGPTQGRATRRSRSMKVKTSARYWSDVVSYPRHPEVTPSQWHTGLPQAIRKLPQGPNPIGTLVPHHRWFGKQNM